MIVDTARQCLRHVRTSRVAQAMPHIEHAIYGVTYLMIGFTEWHGIYYCFGVFVLVTMVVCGTGEKS